MNVCVTAAHAWDRMLTGPHHCSLAHLDFTHTLEERIIMLASLHCGTALPCLHQRHVECSGLYAVVDDHGFMFWLECLLCF